jgi:hypothetical protein
MKSILIILASILINFSSQLSQECFEEFSSHTHPSQCCRYPLIIPHEYQEVIDCQSECDFSNICCRQECFYSKLNLFEGEKLQKENLLKVLLENVKDEKLREEWKEPIEKNIEMCESYSKLS